MIGLCLTGDIFDKLSVLSQVRSGSYNIAAFFWMYREEKVAWDYLLLGECDVGSLSVRDD